MKKGGKAHAPALVQPSRRESRRLRTNRSPRSSVVTPAELTTLQERLRELTETVEALRTGSVDAVVVSGPNGSQIYSLAGAEHPYRIYVERMQEGAVTVSPDGIILYTNQRFSEMLGLPLERVIGSDVREHLGATIWSEISRVFHSGTGPAKQVSTLAREGGPPLPVNLAVSGLQIDEREMLCLVVTDLTEQFHTTEMRVAKESAERANVAKDDFLAALSHELRTPLTPALVSAATVEADSTLPEHLREEISAVRRNVELEARLIDDLLDLTRITRGKLEMHPAPLEFHAVLDEALAICQADIDTKELVLRVRKNAQHTDMLGDAVRIQQVLWNLLRNAVKFTPPQGTISIHTSNTAPGHVLIEVTDSGIGFDAATSARMFNAFEQGSREITRQFGGLGLGLAISRSIAEAHGGMIRACSRGPGTGACFSLELPLLTQGKDPRAPAPTPPNSAENAPGLRILLVEDHKDTRMVLERVLRRQNHAVLAAADARAALELAESHAIDIVISDLGLPDQSGLELMRQLRDRFGLRGIAVSGYGMDEDVAKSHSAGFVHHLTKPISVQRLRQLIALVQTDDCAETPAGSG